MSGWRIRRRYGFGAGRVPLPVRPRRRHLDSLTLIDGLRLIGRDLRAEGLIPHLALLGRRLSLFAAAAVLCLLAVASLLAHVEAEPERFGPPEVRILAFEPPAEEIPPAPMAPPLPEPLPAPAERGPTTLKLAVRAPTPPTVQIDPVQRAPARAPLLAAAFGATRMNPALVDLIPSGELALTCLATLLSLVAVGVPFRRGLKIFLKARGATRPVDGGEIREHLREGSRDGKDSIALLLADVLEQSFRENTSEAHPTEFIRDASRQYAMNEYDVAYAQPISMYANLLPPIGFIGTTVGLMILFLSMRAANDSLEIGALAIALTSTIFALLGFATLEALKIKLYGRLLGCLDDALGCEIAPVGATRQIQHADALSG